MSQRYEQRSREAPMDFEFTNKNRDVIPVDSPFRSTKRSYIDMATPAPGFPSQTSLTPTFGPNSNVPFVFHQPFSPSHHPYPWDPSTSPRTIPQPSTELNDVTMQDSSPAKPEMPPSPPNVRAVATGALKRVFRSRQKQNRRSQRRGHNNERFSTDDEELSGDNQVQDHAPIRRRRSLQKSYSEPVPTANYNHHYTLHVPSPQLSYSEIPYILLGYLQFFFNLSLTLGLLYLLFCFIRAVRKDVEQKMAERTLETLQDIKACASLYTDNFCSNTPSPIIIHKCHEWKSCMERDASIVGRTKLLAELIGEVINGFIEPITWRTMLFVTTSLTIGTVFINTLLIFYRSRNTPAYHNLAPPSVAASGTSSPPFVFNERPPYLNQRPAWPFSGMVGQPDQGKEINRTWSMGTGEDSLEIASRRRKLTENDAVEVR